MNEIIIFENQKIKLEVNIEEDNVWLSREQMMKLFNSSRTNIIDHIKNIYEEEELEELSTCRDFRQVQKEGNRNVSRTIKLYNLDVIISVGYRVKSQNGVIFRKWANHILKDYMLKGYAINQKRLEYLEKTVKLIDIAGRIDINSNANDAQEIIKVINNYKDALNLLDAYDHKTITKPDGKIDKNKITYEECINIIDKLKFNNESDLFALERDKGLEAIIGAIYQTYDKNDIYPTIEEKAANLLYLITKNHVFIDGNKRIAATLFIYFLDYYNILYKDKKQIIDNNTLVAITILIAQSNPNEKNILVDLIMNFLKFM